MRILQVSPYFPPYVGGQERYVRSLAKGLADRGHKVTVFTSNFPKGKKNKDIDGIEVRRFDFLCRPLNNPIFPTLAFQLIKHCKNFDIIHTHNEHTFTSQCCSLAKSYSKVPLVVTCHGQLRFDQLAKDLIERTYSKTLGARLLKKADMVIAISDSDKKHIHSLGVPMEKIRVIPNGVDLARYSFEPNDPPERMIFEGKQVVLFVGPLLKRKGPQVLIQAIPLITKENPDVVFVFVGGGNFKEETEKLSQTLNVEKYTCFTGYVSEDQLHYLYQRSDVFVLPSFSEALSFTILDAFVFSKPVVSTQIPCIKDYLSGTALLVQPRDFKALARAVVNLLSDKKLARELGARGRRLVETHFRWDIVVRKVLEVYCEALNNQ